jgi:hypothetical protein
MHLGDLPAHDTGSDDPGFEYEHARHPSGAAPRRRGQSGLRSPSARVAKRASVRRSESLERAAHEQPVDQRRERVAALELVVEAERDAGVVAVGLENDCLRAPQALVVDLERLAAALLLAA